MKIYVDESPPGSGKSYHAANTLASMPCKALFITERIESFNEVEDMIRKAMARHGTHPVIRRINGDELGFGNSVSREIERLPRFYHADKHVIVLATHAGLLRSDFGGFHGWWMVIDEVPALLDFQQKMTHLDAAFFQKFYQLAPYAEGWSTITLSDAGQALSVAAICKDESHEHLKVFHARVIEASRPGAKRHVLCNLPDWDAMADEKVEWCWASAFSLRELEAFDRVEMLGNRFRRDIGCQLTRALDGKEVEWELLPMRTPWCSFVQRTVHIRYFSEVRTAARGYFESDDGQEVLAAIGNLLGEALPHKHSIWSANATAGPSGRSPKAALALPDSDYLTPKQAGTNRHKAKSHAAMIYAAKPCSNLRGLLKLFGIHPDQWTKSIEHETILQFVTRTSVRDPDNCSPVHVWVFDREQALYLKGYFDSLLHVTADVEQVADAPDIALPEKRGPKSAVRTPEEQVEYEAAKRRQDAERKRESRARVKALKKAA